MRVTSDACPLRVEGSNRVNDCNGGKSLDGIGVIDKGLNRGRLYGAACSGKRLDDGPAMRVKRGVGLL